MKDYKQLFEQYLTEDKKVSKNTFESYIRDINQYFDYASNTDISDIAEADNSYVKEYISFLESRGKSRSTVVRVVATIRCFYQFLVIKGYSSTNPANGIKFEKTEKKLPEILTNKEI